MKRLKIFTLYILTFLVPFSFSYSQDFNSVYSKYRLKDYFHFSEDAITFANANQNWQSMYFTALSDCIFAKFESSKNLISNIISNYQSEIPDSLMKDVYEKKFYDNIFMFEYKDALESAEILLSKYSQFLSKEEEQEFKDNVVMLKQLKDAPPQKISKKGEQKFKIKKDIAGLWNIPVNINDSTYQFVFDTGADFSVVVESMAKKLNLNVSNEEFSVGTSTDKRISSKIAVAKSIKIGGITLENVLFLVMKDADFTFGPYKIEGVIGAPIIRSLGEIKFTKDEELIIPDVPEKSELKNFAYSGFTPIIQMIYGNDSLNFVFDSGNNAISLFPPFFNLYSKEITGKYELKKIQTGGAGGIIEADGYIIDNIILKTGNASAKLNNVSLFIIPFGDNQKFFHGNLGQFYIQQFDTLTLNYANMYIEFSK